jgi:radical SAM protein with 4Fe4S-binding SPASM domain
MGRRLRFFWIKEGMKKVGRKLRTVKEKFLSDHEKWIFMKNEALTNALFVRAWLNEVKSDFVRRHVFHRRPRLQGIFSSTNIETFGKCNRRCSFCFNSRRFPQREEGVMEWGLWKKIVDELSSINFAGRISPHHYGEPLLDKRLATMVNYAREKCKHASIVVYTNGDLLNEPILRELIIRGADWLLVTDYEEVPQVRLRELQEKYPYWIRLRHGVCPSNKAGLIFERSNRMVHEPCLRPSSQLVINWKGEVLLCCNDYYGKRVFGDVNEETVLDVWNSADFVEIRRKLREYDGRKEVDICRECDMLD